MKKALTSKRKYYKIQTKVQLKNKYSKKSRNRNYD